MLLISFNVFASPHATPNDASINKQILTNKTFYFKDLGYSQSIHLQGTQSSVYVGFGSRLDEIVLKAALHLSVTPSPALLSVVSHLKIYLNNELVGVLAIKKAMLGNKSTFDIDIDPRLFGDYNQFKFELVGSLIAACSDPNDGAIWVEISPQSNISVVTKKTKINNDLSLLPAPFFDSRDFSAINLPMIIGTSADIDEIKTLGIVASYFGSLAKWRSTSFPILKDELPTKNSIVFMTNNNKPSFLRHFPDTDGPRIQMISAPNNPYIKLLLIMGRDSKDLLIASKGFILGQKLLTGPVAKINYVEHIMARKAYDAPNWINTHRAVFLSELLPKDAILQVEGQNPPPIMINFRLPPDLFTWNSNGIPFVLNYRYTPPLKNNSGSRLSLSVNKQFIKAFRLNTSGESDSDVVLRLPLLDNNFLGDGQTVNLSGFKVGIENEIKFEFGFASLSGGKNQCQTVQPSKNYAMLSSDSSLDFSGFSHYIKMPNMRAFANSGYPFTRMADLSDTVVVLARSPSDEEIQTFINMMGIFGRDTGYPALQVTLTNKWDEKELIDKDILSIGVMPELISADKNDIEHIQLLASSRVLDLPHENKQGTQKNWTKTDTVSPKVADRISINAFGDFATISSVQSPYSEQRTIVSLLAQSPQSFALFNQSLNDSGKVSAMFGTLITLRNNEVASFNVGEHYYVGHLPVLQLIWYHFSKHPLLIAFFAILLVVMLTIILYRILRQKALRRLNQEEDE